MVLILIFAEVLGLYGYGFIVAAVSIQRLTDATTGQAHRRADNEHQSNGCKVFMTYITASYSPAQHDLHSLLSTERHELAPESAMHILLTQHPEQYKRGWAPPPADSE